jgi:hypothetical protein
MLQNHDECQTVFEEMKKYSAIKQDLSDLFSENIVANCEKILN